MIESIVAALVAGAAAGSTATASAAVTDAYEALKAGIRRVLRQAKSPDAEVVQGEVINDADVVAVVEAAPERRGELESALAAVEADKDRDVVAAARRLLELVDPDGTRAGKYAGMQVHDNQGVVIGDGTHATFNFGPK